MDNEYNAYEPEEDSKKRFNITRGKIILIAVAIIVLVLIIVIIVSRNAMKPIKITEADYHKLEMRMEEEVPSYVPEVTTEISRVELSDMLRENGGVLDANDFPAINVCDGYAVAYLEDGEEIDDAYISCKDGYKTPGYDDGTTEKPVITLNGNAKMIITQGDKFVDPGAVATDDVDGVITNSIKVTGKVNTAVAGTYTIKYTVEDSSGNKVSKKRTVIVKEKETTTTSETTTTITTTTTKVVPKTTYTTRRKTTTRAQTTRRATTKRITTPPTITLKGSNPYNITQGTTYVDPGFTAKDALGKNITNKVTKRGSVNSSVAKTYYIVYSVKDDYNNEASITRTVKVNAKSTVTGLTLTPNTLNLKVGKTYKLDARATYTGSAPTYTWSSSNTSVATVSGDGTVTAKSAGSSTITVSAGSYKKTCNLKVVK